MMKTSDIKFWRYGIKMMKSISLLLFSLTFHFSCASVMTYMGHSDTSNPTIKVVLENKKIISIPLEKYVLGVLSKEVPEDWPLEAIKAQAVASRTYAMYRKAHPRDAKYDVSATTADQVFDKKHKYANSFLQALQETKGEVLTYQGQPFEAFFHSACGGASEKASHVWPGTYPPSVESVHEDHFCIAAPHFNWTYTISEETLENILTDKGYTLPKDWNIGIDKRDEFGRVQTLTIESNAEKYRKKKSSQVLNSNTLREMVGYAHIQSTFFDMSDDENGIVFTGKGSGHGVGLCQWGAKGQAEEGKSYREILTFYYPESDLLPLDPKLIIKKTDADKLNSVPANTQEPTASPDTSSDTSPDNSESQNSPSQQPQASPESTKEKTRNGVEAIISTLPPEKSE